MTTSPRALTVVYGAETFGAASTRQIDGNLEVRKTARDFSLEFQLLVSNTTDALFAADLATVENAVRTPYQDLVVTLNSEEQYDFRGSTRQALNVVGEVIRRADAPGTRIAQVLTIRFTGDLAADESAGLPASIVGLREGVVTTEFDPGRVRTVTISGEWTATPTPSQGAKTAYESASAGASAYAASVLSAIDSSAAWELQEEDMELLDSDVDALSEGGVLAFRRAYRELVFGSPGEALAAGVQTGNVVRQIFKVTRTGENPGNSPGTRPLRTAEVSYDCWIDRSQTTGSPALENLWDNTIRPFVVSQIQQSGLLSGAVGILRERPTFHYDENRISASMTAQGFGGPIIERRISVEDFETGGKTAVPVWDGNPRSRYVFESHIERTRTILETARVVLDLDVDEDFLEGMGVGIVGDLNGIIIEKRSTSTPIILGSNESGGELKVVEIQGKLVVQLFERTNGARLSSSQRDQGQSPFLFDANLGVFDLRVAGGGVAVRRP